MPVFQVKDFLSIVAGMINVMRAGQGQVTDFNVGSVARSMLEAPAAEIDQLYQRMLAGLQQAIPVAVFNTFDFPPLPARAASGLVRVSVASQPADVTITAGTRLTRADGAVSYLVATDVVIPTGDTFADVLAVAETPGAIGNFPSGTTFSPSPTPQGFVDAVALAAVSSGADPETDAEHKARFNGYISSLARGTVAALHYGLTLVQVTDAAGNVVERVALATIEEPWLADPVNFPPGLVNVRIHNGAGTTSPALVAEAQKVLDGYYAADGTPVPGWKAAGAKVVVAAAVEVAVPVTATLTIDPALVAADVLDAAEAAITNYLATLAIGADVVRAEIITAAMNIPGVLNIALAAPTGDVAIAATHKAMPGAITLTAA